MRRAIDPASVTRVLFAWRLHAVGQQLVEYLQLLQQQQLR